LFLWLDFHVIMEIPFIILSMRLPGICNTSQNHTTSAVVAEQYFETIKAPKKELFWFEHSGHSPNWEEPALFYQRVLQVAADNKIN
jgi:hypothetical protein